MMWLIIIFIIYYIFKVLFNWFRPRKFPPGPLGLPFVHNIFDLKNLVQKTGSHGNAWCQLAKEYGSVVGLRLGLADPLIIVSGRDAVMEVLRRSEFDGRPNDFMFTRRTMGKKRGILFTDGKVWNDQRRFSLKNLKNFGWEKQTMEELILEDAVNLNKLIEQTSDNGLVKNLNELITLAVLNSLWSMLTGVRYNIGKRQTKLINIVDMVNDAVKESNVSGGLLNHFPFLRYLAPRSSGYKTISERFDRIWSFFSDEITSHKETRHAGLYRSLIDVYLEQIDADKNNPDSTFNDMELIAVLKDLFSAGIDTTRNSIGFTIGYLTIYPQIQHKVHEEIDRIIGRDNLPSLNSRNSMPYLNATLTEVLRLANIGPTTIPHRATVNTILKGYDIKKNYTILPNLMSVHKDKEHWGDPEVFRPERFIDENGAFINDSWIIPFGVGRRKCLGEGLAKSSHFLFVACLLQRFKFILPPGQERPVMTGIDGFTLSPPVFDILIYPR
ncbi:methyl farnesoate epoxidase-like [Chelonus insularis]|uniref:methyl farnesoate epoxidase-like n=1 Tax=Chelonus insularis TaxID=460826 RepID=UPI00158D1F7C|nr:methyl farnesoate epoxidase-like [Chelonus insularis]